MADWRDELSKLLPGAEARRDEPLSLHTTFRIGGPAEFFLDASGAEETACAVSFCQEKSVRVTVLGNGSNTLALDEGVRGLVLRIGPQMADVTVSGTEITAGAGAMLPRLARFACEQSLSGLEWAAGIPGTLGGGLCMNAGAYGGEMSGCVTLVKALTPEGNRVSLRREQMRLSYRRSAVADDGLIVLSAVLSLAQGDATVISAKMADYSKRRSDKQPLALPSAGSAFKRPKGDFAGRLIELSGLKGLAVGGARVSEKHAGFIVNTGGATAKDVLALIDEVRERVLADHGVALEPEIRVIG